MSVVSVNRMWSKKRGGVTSTDRKTYTARLAEGYQVVLDDPLTTFAEIMRHPDIPRVGSRRPGSSSIYCTSVIPTQTSPIMVVVDVEYEGKVGPDGTPEDSETGGDSDSPINQPPDIQRSIIIVEADVDEDYDGNAIVTANNEPIRGVRRMIADTVFTIKRNFLTFDDLLTEEYYLAVNSDPFLRREPGRCLIKDFRVKEIIDRERSITYYEASVVIHVRKPYNTTADKAWYYRHLHEGMRVKVGSAIIDAVDSNKKPETKPVMLKADGTRETVAANAVYLEWKLYPSLPYSALGLID